MQVGRKLLLLLLACMIPAQPESTCLPAVLPLLVLQAAAMQQRNSTQGVTA